MNIQAQIQDSPLKRFRRSLDGTDVLDKIRAGLIGDNQIFDTPSGPQTILYADYTASGRALRQIENFVMDEILPFYANSHTEDSYCGMRMTVMREEARRTIAQLVNADSDCHVLFTGSGATAGFNRIAHLLRVAERVAEGQGVRILIGPYEHHSNILPWRETGADVREIPEGPGGGPDLLALEAELKAAADCDLVVGSFSAASNVTGTMTAPDPVTRLLKAHGALAIWDYACAAPYLPMDLSPSADAEKDAIVFSAHKFPGGPAASGVTVIRDTIVQNAIPTFPGGGTVAFVSPWRHTYSPQVEDREEGGTPNVIGDIRAALVMLVKDAVGVDEIAGREDFLRNRALEAFSEYPAIRALGHQSNVKSLPIFSFQIFADDGAQIHQQLITRMLSDVHGVQARGGCACAGPYAHRLLDLDEARSNMLFDRLEAGNALSKPGWTRLNLSYLHSEKQLDHIFNAVIDISARATELATRYTYDPNTACFSYAA